MAEYLAIDWEAHQLSVAELDVSKSRLRVQRVERFEWPESFGPRAKTDEIGEWLKGKLSEAGFGSRQVLLCLPRELVVLRQLDLPVVPDEELPDLVRLQAATKSTVAIDQVAIDFVPLPADVDSEGRHVLLATLQKERLQRMTGALAAAGLTVISVGVSSLGTAELVDRAEQNLKLSPAGLSVVVAQHGERVELTMMHSRHVVFSHSTQIQGSDPVDDARSVLSEISRAIVSFERMMSRVTVSRVWLLRDVADETLSDLLKKRFDCDVHLLDPFELPFVAGKVAEVNGRHATLAGPLGLAFALEESGVPQLDFLNPRKRPEIQDNRRIKVLAAVGAAVVLVAGGYSYQMSIVDGLETDIAMMNTKAQTVSRENKDREPLLESAAEIRNWQEADFDWLATLGSVNQTLRQVNAADAEGSVTSDSHRVYLSELHVEGGTVNSLAHVRASGHARSGNDVDQLKQELRSGNVDVFPSQTKWSREDASYLRQFPLEFDVAPRTVETTSRGRSSRRRGSR